MPIGAGGRNTADYRAVSYITVQYSTTQYSTVLPIGAGGRNTADYSAVPYITVQYSTTQYSTVLPIGAGGRYTADYRMEIVIVIIRMLSGMVQKKMPPKIPTRKVSKAIKWLAILKPDINYIYGLSPARMLWIYKPILLPRITYGSHVWGHSLTLEQQHTIRTLESLTFRYYAPIWRTTPTASFEVILNKKKTCSS